MVIDMVAPERRRAVVVLDGGERREILRDPDRVDLLDDTQTAFVTFPDGGGQPDGLADLLRNQDLLRPGTVAVQSPYATDRYVAADRAIAEFTVEKFFILVRLMKLLGATRVSFSNVREDHQKTEYAGPDSRSSTQAVRPMRRTVGRSSTTSSSG